MRYTASLLPHWPRARGSLKPALVTLMFLTLEFALPISPAPTVAWAGEVTPHESTEDALPPPTEMSSAEGKKLVAAFEKTFRAARKLDAEAARLRAEGSALRALASHACEPIAKRLLELGSDADMLPDTRVLALRALAVQGEGARSQSKRLLKWLQKESEDATDDLQRGRIGVPVDKRTGDPVTDTAEARECLRLGAARARVLTLGLETALQLEAVPAKPGELLRPFLQSPEDPLAIVAVRAARAWRAQDLLEDLGLLLHMYPRANRWETGAVTHLGGTNASAKSAWMTLFGHPGKQRARPHLYHAVVDTLSEWAEQRIEDPETLDAWKRARK